MAAAVVLIAGFAADVSRAVPVEGDWQTTRGGAIYSLQRRFPTISKVDCQPDRKSANGVYDGYHEWHRFFCSGRTANGHSFTLTFIVTGKCDACEVITNLKGASVADLGERGYQSDGSANQPRATFTKFVSSSQPWTNEIDICVNHVTNATPLALTITDQLRSPVRSSARTSRRTYRFTASSHPRNWTTESYRLHRGSTEGSCAVAEVVISDTYAKLASYVSQAGVLTLRMTAKNRLVGAAAYKYTVQNTRGRVIDEGADDFVNVCINDLKSIYSSGGTLYCLTDDIHRVTLNRVW